MNVTEARPLVRSILLRPFPLDDGGWRLTQKVRQKLKVRAMKNLGAAGRQVFHESSFYFGVF